MHGQSVSLPLLPLAPPALLPPPPSPLLPSSQVAADHGFDYMRDQNVALLARAVYSSKLPRLVAVLRNPIDRIHSAFYGYPHYFGR